MTRLKEIAAMATLQSHLKTNLSDDRDRLRKQGARMAQISLLLGFAAGGLMVKIGVMIPVLPVLLPAAGAAFFARQSAYLHTQADVCERARQRVGRENLIRRLARMQFRAQAREHRWAGIGYLSALAAFAGTVCTITAGHVIGPAFYTTPYATGAAAFFAATFAATLVASVYEHRNHAVTMAVRDISRKYENSMLRASQKFMKDSQHKIIAANLRRGRKSPSFNKKAARQPAAIVPATPVAAPAAKQAFKPQS